MQHHKAVARCPSISSYTVFIIIVMIRGVFTALFLGGLNSNDISEPWKLCSHTPSIDYQHLHTYIAYKSLPVIVTSFFQSKMWSSTDYLTILI